MTIRDIVRQGFYYARTCKWLWLFGFFVAVASGGSNGGSRGGGVSINTGTGIAIGGPFEFSPGRVVLLAAVVAVAILVGLVIRFVGEGALIEGIGRARRGDRMTLREGFRVGWAHWGVLLRIGLLYVAATLGCLTVLAAPVVLAARAFGVSGALLAAAPAVIVALPVLVTLYLVQAFAARIAVLDNRHALDAIAKARLFLHGRLVHGLKLMIATLVGTVGIAVLAIVLMVPLALLFVAALQVLHVVLVSVLACLIALPLLYVLAAVLGTYRSSIWTIGYLTQVEA